MHLSGVFNSLCLTCAGINHTTPSVTILWTKKQYTNVYCKATVHFVTDCCVVMMCYSYKAVKKILWGLVFAVIFCVGGAFYWTQAVHVASNLYKTIRVPFWNQNFVHYCLSCSHKRKGTVCILQQRRATCFHFVITNHFLSQNSRQRWVELHCPRQTCSPGVTTLHRWLHGWFVQGPEWASTSHPLESTRRRCGQRHRWRCDWTQEPSRCLWTWRWE